MRQDIKKFIILFNGNIYDTRRCQKAASTVFLKKKIATLLDSSENSINQFLGNIYNKIQKGHLLFINSAHKSIIDVSNTVNVLIRK